MLYSGSNFKWPVLEVKPIADTTKYITGLRSSRPIIYNSGFNVWFFPPCGCHSLFQMSKCWKTPANSSVFLLAIKTQALGTTERVDWQIPWAHVSFIFFWVRIKLQRYFDFILTSQENYRDQVDLFFLFIKEEKKQWSSVYI